MERRQFIQKAGVLAGGSLVHIPLPRPMRKPRYKLGYQLYSIRDEMANMVWGVEHTVPNGFASGRNAQEAALASLNFVKSVAPEPTPDALEENNATIKFQLGTTVEENWIPFIPTHVSDQNRAIRLH